MNIGQSIGSTIVGIVLDAHGPAAGLALPMMACAVSIPLIALSALSARRGFATSRQERVRMAGEKRRV